MTVETLIEDYQRRLKTIDEMMVNSKKPFSGIPGSQLTRINIKSSCYRTFVSELEELKQKVDAILFVKWFRNKQYEHDQFFKTEWESKKEETGKWIAFTMSTSEQLYEIFKNEK